MMNSSLLAFERSCKRWTPKDGLHDRIPCIGYVIWLRCRENGIRLFIFNKFASKSPAFPAKN